MTGKGANGVITPIEVPIMVGARDRVVSAIQSRNTQNLAFPLPMLSAYISNIALAPERRKGISVINRERFLPAGGIWPTDLEVAQRVMPIPYNLEMELSIYTSNTNQMHQILEQILMIFDPIVQIQKTDATFDWTKITHVELTGINNEENHPMGTDKRIKIWSLIFDMPIYLSAPLELKNNIVHDIQIRIGNIQNFTFNEYDENGDLQPFGADDLWSTSNIGVNNGGLGPVS